MPEIQVTDEQGNIHIFPDGSTPEMISKAMNLQPSAAAQPSAPSNSIRDTLAGNAPWQQAIDKAAQTEPYQGNAGDVGRFISNLGAGAVGLALQPFAHPVQTLRNMVPVQSVSGTLQQGFDQQHQMQQPGTPGQMAATATALIPGVVLAGAGNDAANDATAALKNQAGRATRAVGNTAQDAGVGLMNKTIGTLKPDFKRGANPARGYLETNNGPALSLQGLADKAAESKSEVGQTLGNIYSQATAAGAKIPVQTVADEMAKPLQKAIDLETGPGGTGNLTAIKSYIEQFGPSFARAEANGGFTPTDVFEMKKRIADNTNWSDPTQFSLKAVRQQQTGALSGILSDAFPETTDLNQHYQDLTKFVNRAQERANTGSIPLTSHFFKAGMTGLGAIAGGAEGGHALAGAALGAAMDSVPVKSAVASGLFRGGRAISRFATPAQGAPVEDVPADNLGNYGQAAKGNNPHIAPRQLGDGTTPSDIEVLMQILRRKGR